MQIPMPKLLYDEKYKEWVIFDDPYEMFVLKPNAPKELQEALQNFHDTIDMYNTVMSVEDYDKWIEELESTAEPY